VWGRLWLRRHDPRYLRGGVRQEVWRRLSQQGTTARQVRVALANGRPSGHRYELRAQVRAVLLSLWRDDWRRTYVAEALRCARSTLYRLMGDVL
jgi:hypothetical protein